MSSRAIIDSAESVSVCSTRTIDNSERLHEALVIERCRDLLELLEWSERPHRELRLRFRLTGDLCMLVTHQTQ